MKTKYRNLMLFTVFVVSCFWSLIFLFKFQMLCHWLAQGGFTIKWWQVFAKIKKLLPRYKHSPNMTKTNSSRQYCDRIFPFYFYFSHQIIESELSMSSQTCASRTTSVNFWFSQYLSSSPGEKSACTRPDQILWSSVEVGRSRSFSTYFSFPWL